MKKIVLVLAVLLLVSIIGDVQASTRFETLTVTSGAVKTITSTTYNPVSAQRNNECYCTLETASLRFRIDGTDPTASVGHLLNAGDSLILQDDQIGKFKAIAVSTTCSLSCSCYVGR
jgi:hypothetical protein